LMAHISSRARSLGYLVSPNGCVGFGAGTPKQSQSTPRVRSTNRVAPMRGVGAPAGRAFTRQCTIPSG
jgi:hypothetical protein